MCAITGFLDYGHRVHHRVLLHLVKALTVAAECRGTDATGMSYVKNGEIVLMASFGTPDAVTAMTNRAYDTEFTYSYKVKLEQGISADDAEELKKEYGGQLMEVVQGFVYVNENKEELQSYLVTVFSDGAYINLNDTDGNAMNKEGIYVTEGIAEALDLKIGDTVHLSPSLKKDYCELKVAGLEHFSLRCFEIKMRFWKQKFPSCELFSSQSHTKSHTKPPREGRFGAYQYHHYI